MAGERRRYRRRSIFAGSLESSSLPAPDAPTLTLTTGATDNTPGFDVTNVLSADGVRVEYATLADFSNASSVTGTASSGTISIVTGALADGTWYFRARIERTGYTVSGWSNTVSETIDATAPTITSANSTSVAENATLAWSIVTDENATVVIGGTDAARFELASNPSSTTRTLRWASNGTKDFEAPNDANTDNVYVCTLTPTDAVGNVGNAQTFSATVTDVADTSSIAFLVGTSAVTAAGNTVTTSAIDTTGADFIIALVADYADGTGISVSDDIGGNHNTWTAMTAVVKNATRARLYWTKPTSVGSGHTFSELGGFDFPSIYVLAFSGVHATPADVEATGTGTGTTASAGAGITPTQNSELVIAGVAIALNSVSSINSSFLINAGAPAIAASSGTNLGGAIAYKIQGTAAAVDPDWTLSGSTDWAAAIASFKAA